MAILGLLKDQDLHGYELKRRLGQTLGVLSSVSFGSVYPALARLERAGAVKVVAGGRPRVPMTGSLGGERAAFRAAGRAGRSSRGRKVYGITPEGERLFQEMLSASSGSPDDSRGFSLKLAFARYLSPEARIRLLERRRAELIGRLERARQAVAGAAMDPYAASVVKHSEDATEREIDWIEHMIEAERGRAGRSPTRERQEATVSKGEA